MPKVNEYQTTEELKKRYGKFIDTLKKYVPTAFDLAAVSEELVDLITHAQMEAMIYARTANFEQLRQEWSEALTVMLLTEPRSKEKKG